MPRHNNGIGFDKQVAKLRIRRSAIAVKYPSGNPHSALRRHNPQSVGDLTRYGPAQRKNQLALVVPMYRNFGFVLLKVQAKSHGGLVGFVQIEIGTDGAVLHGE